MPRGGVRYSDCLRLITVEWEEEVHRGDATKAIRLTVGVGGCLNVCICMCSVSVGTVWYANPILINVWDVRIVVEPQSQSAQDPHRSLRASSVPFSTCLSLFFTLLLFTHCTIDGIKRVFL